MSNAKARMSRQQSVLASGQARTTLSRLGILIACIGFIQACAPITQLPQNLPLPTPPASQSPSSPSSGLPTPPSPSGPPSLPAPPGPPSSPGLPSPPGELGKAGEPGKPPESQLPPGSDSNADGTPGPDGEPGWLEDLEGGPTDDWQTSNEDNSSQTNEGENDGSAEANEHQPGERKSAAEKDLEGALEDFDGEILAERGALKKAADSYPTPTTPDLKQGGETTAGADDTTADASRQQPRARIPNRPPPPKRGNEELADDVPDAKDDDIIARQLREAALQESDPELKEKLWQEYQRYKNG